MTWKDRVVNRFNDALIDNQRDPFEQGHAGHFKRR